MDFFLEEVLLVTLETEAGAITCVDIDIMDDTTFEDVENFRVALSTGSNDTNIQTGEIVESTVLIDDRGKRGRGMHGRSYVHKYRMARNVCGPKILRIAVFLQIIFLQIMLH